jgi:hypothetical protein
MAKGAGDMMPCGGVGLLGPGFGATNEKQEQQEDRLVGLAH